MLNNIPSTAEKLHQQAMERRIRLGMGRKVVNVHVPRNTVFDYHVTLFRIYWTNLIETFSMRKVEGYEQPTKYSAYQQTFIIDDEPLPVQTMKQITLSVLEEYPGVTLDMLRGARRDVNVVRPRMMAMYRIRTEQPWRSFPAIGRFFNKDHSCAVNAFHKMKAAIEGNEEAIKYLQNKNRRYKKEMEN